MAVGNTTGTSPQRLAGAGGSTDVVADREGPATDRSTEGPGMRHCTVLALTALAGCLFLVASIAVLTAAWAVHPALTIVPAAGLGWIAVRLAGWLFTAETPTA